MVRVLSGTRPTGKLHLGNLLGALENFKKLEGAESFFMIADWHALTTEYESHTSIRQSPRSLFKAKCPSTRRWRSSSG